MPRVKLLGGALVEDEGGMANPISSRRYPLALLALLSTAPSRTLSRGKLVGLLWPDAPERTARNRLTSCVYEVRHAFGDDALLSLGADVRLAGGGLDCDVRAFADAIERRDYRAAVALYSGPFLDGFALPDTPEFEHHVDRLRTRFQSDQRAALEALAEQAEEEGRADAAAHWWRERMSEEPHDSRVVRKLMDVLARNGSRAEALRIAARHVELLESEFGTSPDAEFTAFVERLQTPQSDVATGTSSAPSALPVRSIAVLPFENLGGTPDAELFAAGLHEDLLTELSRISGLTVISRTSLLRFRRTDQPLLEIARELGAGTIVEGAVQTAGGRVRLNVQLIDAATDSHRWVERYDRALSTDSILEIQTELARRIATTLEARLAPATATPMGEPSGDLQAYRLYIQGRGLLDQRTRHEMYRSIDYFRRAIERDEAYGPAWSGLADALSILEFYHYPAPEAAPDPIDAARRAVALAPRSGPAHASLGIIQSIRQDGPAALRELETAITLAPSYAEAHAWLGWLHLLRGCPERALSVARRAVELDPLAPAFRAYLAETYLTLGRGGLALEEAVRAREIQPGYGLAHFMAGLALHHLGRQDEAREALEAALPLVPAGGTPSHAEIHATLGVVHAAAGDAAAARERLERVRDAGHPFSIGLAHAALGETGAAFDAFETTRDWRSFSTEHFRYFFPAVLGPMRRDARGRAILRMLDRRWGRDASGTG